MERKHDCGFCGRISLRITRRENKLWSLQKCLLIKNAGSCEEEGAEISPLSYLDSNTLHNSRRCQKNYTPAETGLNNRDYDLKYNMYRLPFQNLLKEDCVKCCFLSGMVICREFLNEYNFSKTHIRYTVL
jgi:hypothetical protein